MDVNPLIGKLAKVRSQLRVLLAGSSLFRFLATASLVVATSFLLDWLFQLPIGARIVLFIAMLVFVLRGAFQTFIRPFTLPMSDDAVALHVQARNPQFGDSLISAIQLSRELKGDSTTESRSMIAAAIAQITSALAKENFSKSVPMRSLAKPALLASVLLVAILGYGASKPELTKLWFARCILLGEEEWPKATTLEVIIANLDQYRHEVDDSGNYEVWVPEGSVVLVQTTAIGEVPNSVRLHKYALPRTSGNRPITIEIARHSESDVFEYRFGRVRESFGFCVEGGDDTDEHPYFTVNVRTAPKVEELLVNYDFPEYINDVGREDRENVREYNIVGPMGTEIAMYFRTSSEVVQFDIVLDEAADKTIRLEPTPDDPRLFEWRFQLNDDHFYTYRLIGANGAPSYEAPNFNISAQPDVPPDIAIQRPVTTTVDVTANATLPLKFQVVDDYRVGNVSLRWDGSREGDFKSRREFGTAEMRLSEEMRDTAVFAALTLSDFTIEKEGRSSAPEIGDRVFIKLEATDTRLTATEPTPNTTVYPSLLVLNIREATEIERDLTRTQIRIKGQVARIEESLATKLEELGNLIEAPATEDASTSNETIQTLISAQALMTSGLDESTRGFVRVFDGYLFNRLDNSNLTETLISSICGAHKNREGNHLDFIAEILPRERQLINDTEAMGKLALIMDLLLDSARNKTKTVDNALRLAFDQPNAESQNKELVRAKAAQAALLAQLRQILEKMEDWEDFQDVVQSLKDIIELEKGLQNRIKKIAK